MSEEKKKKINYKERIGTGPFGVGETVEEVKESDVYDFTTSLDEFKEVTKDLTPEQLEHVKKETKAYAQKYQTILEKFTQVLTSPEGQAAFIKEMKKRSGTK